MAVGIIVNYKLLKFRMWRSDDMPFPQARKLFPQVRELCGTSPGVVRTSHRVVKGLHVTSGLTSEAVLSRWISRHLFWICPLRTRIYVFISPKKHSPPSHRACFILIFSGFWCEGLDFKTFTRAVNAWRGRRKQTFTPGNRLEIRK